ncbi:tetratricopeptide repeat protein [Pikeienuella piscinae]|uniref:Tetratricopeptide repeat protein n=1 Tax=Pikeienuella piscinae TaxID=2748098 RepID=A0A7L5BWC4_9RHOB|nr:tetratricopeptide repeat protein [Pikeienuella piscinae]QIE54536.1 tetratricopeptide repeat protein [Pikeienuella piscinae]
MSDRDSFIDEVSEEVRRDQMYALWRRWGPYVIGGIVVIVALAGGKAWMDAQAVQEARQAGAAMIAASEIAPTEAAEALTTLAEQTGNEGAAVLARLRAAGAFAADGRWEEAAKAYEIVAEDGAADPILRDFAAFRAVMERASGMEPMAQAEALTPITDGNGAFRLLALEAKGAALLAAGDREAAADALRAVAADEAAPQGLRQRVEAVLTAIGAAEEATG